VRRQGVCDDATSALSCGAGPLEGMRPGLMTHSARWRSGRIPRIPVRRLAPLDRNKTLTAPTGPSR
jgi:hypothetical protein